jgi:hypothetical protein
MRLKQPHHSFDSRDANDQRLFRNAVYSVAKRKYASPVAAIGPQFSFTLRGRPA